MHGSHPCTSIVQMYTNTIQGDNRRREVKTIKHLRSPRTHFFTQLCSNTTGQTRLKNNLLLKQYNNHNDKNKMIAIMVI